MKVLISDLLPNSIEVDNDTIIVGLKEKVEVGKEVIEVRVISKVIDGYFSLRCLNLLSNIVRTDIGSDLKLRLVLYYEGIANELLKEIVSNIEDLKVCLNANSLSVEFYGQYTKMGKELLSKSIYN